MACWDYPAYAWRALISPLVRVQEEDHGAGQWWVGQSAVGCKKTGHWPNCINSSINKLQFKKKKVSGTTTTALVGGQFADQVSRTRTTTLVGGQFAGQVSGMTTTALVGDQSASQVSGTTTTGPVGGQWAGQVSGMTTTVLVQGFEMGYNSLLCSCRKCCSTINWCIRYRQTDKNTCTDWLSYILRTCCWPDLVWVRQERACLLCQSA